MKKGILGFVFVIAACLGFAQESENVNLLYHWSNDTIPGSFSYDNTYNEVWGFVQGEKEYGVIGTTSGTHIFDVSDPENSYQAAFVEGEVTGGVIVHRDFHDYNGYLYAVSDEGQSTLQIIDLQYLPDSVVVVYDSSELFNRAHNIFIDQANAILYTCGGTTQFSLYSLEDPSNPVQLLNCQSDVPNWPSTVAYVHDVYVIDNVAYCNAEDGVYVVDFSDLDNPSFLGTLTDYPQSGYNHSGWLHESGNLYAFADETHGTEIKLLNVEDLSDMQVLSTFAANSDANSIVHNLIFDGNLLHVSHYYDGYYVFDISNTDSVIVAGHYATSNLPFDDSYEGCWGIYPLLPSGIVLASDMQEGLFVFDVDYEVGVKTEELAAFSIYPNPLTSNILHLSSPIDGNAYCIFDQAGRIIQQQKMSPLQRTIHIQNQLNDGIYFVQFNTSQGSITKKIIVR